MLWRALRFFAGLVVGIALWYSAAPLYNRLISVPAEPLLHIDSRFAGAVLIPMERAIRITSSTDLPLAHVPADLLTYNIILLLALFATNSRAWSLRNLRALLISAVVLFAAHVAGLLISIESTYALRLGEWSAKHYSDLGQDVWLVLELFYRIVGMFGLAFACWFILSDAKDLGWQRESAKQI
jgi:hypothetical protein